MSKSWVYAILAGVLSVAAIQNVTIDDLDRSIVLTPLQVWSWSNEGTGELNGSFSFSNDGTAAVFFTFPVSATAVYWRGFKRSGAALYSICIDCTGAPNDPSFQPVDGHDGNAMPNGSVTTLFSKTGLSNTIHNLTIRNHLDPRFPGPSQITLDGFIITSSNNQTPVTTVASISTSIPAGPSKTALITSISTSIPADPSQTALITPAINSRLSTHNNISIAIGIAVACIVASIIAVTALIVCLRHRRKRYNQFREKRGGRGGQILPITDTLDISPNHAEQQGMLVSYEENLTTPAESDIYQKFPAPPRHSFFAHQASDNYPSNDIASNIRPAGPQRHHTHFNSENTFLGVPLLLAPEAPHQLSVATTSPRPKSSHIPILITNAFARSSVNEEPEQYGDVEHEPMSPSERKRWYPSILPQDVIEPSQRRPPESPAPAPPERFTKDALSVKSMASLRVSGIVEATREAMTPGIDKSRFAQGMRPSKLSPPFNGTPSSHGVLSSSVFF